MPLPVHYYQPAGVDGPTYDLRFVVSFIHSGDSALVRFFSMPTALVTFDWTSFEAAWDASRLADPSLPSTPAIVGNLPALTVGSTYYNSLFVDQFVDNVADDTVSAAFSGGGIDDESGCLPVDPPVTLDRTAFLALVPVTYPMWNPGAGVVYYNLDNVLCWNQNSDGTTATVRFFGDGTKSTVFDLAAFETAYQASKSRGAFKFDTYIWNPDTINVSYNLRHVLSYVTDSSDSNFCLVRFIGMPVTYVRFDKAAFVAALILANT